MPSAFSGIEMASRALRVFQRGLDVVGHNVSNVNTRGYSRQTVEYATTTPLSFFDMRRLTIGSGVGISSINRIRDGLLDQRMIAAQSEGGRYGALKASLGRIEPVFNEPGDAGISAALDRFFNAWSGLGSNPSDSTRRYEVQLAADSLASRIRSTARQMQELSAQFGNQITGTFDRIDQLTRRVADLNTQIRQQMAMGEVPNDLLDQRDLAIDDLSALINITTFQNEDGTKSVFASSYALVDVGGAQPIPRTHDPATFTLQDGTRAVTVRGGELYGLFESVNKLTAYRARLDTLANSLRDSVNALHVTGTPPSNATAVPFFLETSLGALDFDLSAQVRADTANIASGTTTAAGDGGLALALSQLRDTAHAGLGGLTFGQFYTDLVARVGRDTEIASSNLETHRAVLEQIEFQRQAVSGVSLDDEMATMLRLQRSYQAAAKLLSIFDRTTEDLINIIR